MSRIALVVGINYYSNLTDLRLPASDGEQIANILNEFGDFRIMRLPEKISSDNEVVIDEAGLVKCVELQAAIADLFDPKGEDYPDVGLLYVAGHGLQNTVGAPEGFLAASDSDPASGMWGVSLKWLSELLKNSPIRNQIVWLDTCHSGALLNFAQADPGRGARCIIAASRSYEPAFEDATGEHGVLSGALIDGLNPANGVVTNFSLTAHVTGMLRRETQTPMCANSGHALWLTRGSEEAPEPELPEQDRCPYKGLTYFTEMGDDPNDFYGREALTDELIDHLRQSNFLGVVGVSGSGKSSLIRAGLLHQLSIGTRIGGSNEWRQVIMVPGNEPFGALAAALLEQRDLDRGLITTFLRNPSADLFKQILSSDPNPRKTLLLVDQFEEIITHEKASLEGKKNAADFVGCLAECANDLNDALILVVAIRADFFGKLNDERFREFLDLLQNNQILVQQMSATELRDAIVKPAKSVSFQVDERLVAELLEELRDAPGRLPLLQDALTQLYEVCKSDRHLTYDAYREMGGIGGALSRRATQFYEETLTQPEKRTSVWMFLQLTQFEDNTAGVRRRVPVEQLITLEFDEEIVQATAEKLVDARLLVSSSMTARGGGPDDRSAQSTETLEVAHEALIQNWRLLRSWLDQNREFQAWLQRVANEADEWFEHGKSDEYLNLRGGRLDDAVIYQEDNEGLIPQLTEAYILAALERKEAQERAEEAQRNIRITNLKRIVAIVLVAFAMTGVFAGAAVHWYYESEQKLAQAMAAASIKRASDHLRESQNFDALAQALKARGHFLSAESNSAVLESLLSISEHLSHHIDLKPDIPSSLSWPSKNQIQVGGYKGKIHLIDFGDIINNNIETINNTLPENRSVIKIAKLSSKKGKIVFQNNGTISLLDEDLKIQKQVKTDRKLRGMYVDGGTVFAGAASSPNIIAFENCVERAFADSCWSDIATDGYVRQLEYDVKRKRLFVLQDSGKISALDPATQSEVPFAPQIENAFSTSWSSAIEQLAVVSRDGRVLIVDANGADVVSFNPLRVWSKDAGPTQKGAHGVLWHPTEPILAIICGEQYRQICVWRFGNGNKASAPMPITRLRGHTLNIVAMAWSPDGENLATISSDRSLKIWNLSGDTRAGVRLQVPGLISFYELLASPDGKHLAASGDDGHVHVWSRDESGNLLPEPTTLRGNSNERLKTLDWQPDGKMIAAADDRGTIQFWEWPKPTRSHAVDLFPPDQTTDATDLVWKVRWLKGGNEVVATAKDGIGDPIIWNPKLKQKRKLKGQHEEVPLGLALNPQTGRMLSSDALGKVVMWDAVNGQLAFELPQPPACSKNVDPNRCLPSDMAASRGSLHIDNQGKRALAAGEDDNIVIWDLPERKVHTVLSISSALALDVPSKIQLEDAEFDPGGKRVASLSSDGKFYLWDTEKNALELGISIYTSKERSQIRLRELAFLPSPYPTVAVTSTRGEVRIFSLIPEDWQERARQLFPKVISRN